MAERNMSYADPREEAEAQRRERHARIIAEDKPLEEGIHPLDVVDFIAGFGTGAAVAKFGPKIVKQAKTLAQQGRRSMEELSDDISRMLPGHRDSDTLSMEDDILGADAPGRLQRAWDDISAGVTGKPRRDYIKEHDDSLPAVDRKWTAEKPRPGEPVHEDMPFRYGTPPERLSKLEGSDLGPGDYYQELDDILDHAVGRGSDEAEELFEITQSLEEAARKRFNKGLGPPSGNPKRIEKLRMQIESGLDVSREKARDMARRYYSDVYSFYEKHPDLAK